MAGALPAAEARWHGRCPSGRRRRRHLREREPGHRRDTGYGPTARRFGPCLGRGGRRSGCGRTTHSSRDLVAPVRFPRLPASPIEHSLEGRAFVFSGFAVAVLAIVLYGQDYIVPAVALAVAA